MGRRASASLTRSSLWLVIRLHSARLRPLRLGNPVVGNTCRPRFARVQVAVDAAALLLVRGQHQTELLLQRPRWPPSAAPGRAGPVGQSDTAGPIPRSAPPGSRSGGAPAPP